MNYMMKKILILIVLAGVFASTACTAAPKGSWVVDAGATVENLKKSKPEMKPQEAEWFPLMLGYSFGMVLNFEDDVISVSTYNDDKSRPFCRLVSKQSNWMKYVPKGNEKYVYKCDKDDTWTVSYINNGKNISIESAKNPLQNFSLWKPVKLDPASKNSAAKRFMDDYKKMIEDIKSIPLIAAETKKWDDEALLHDGRTVEVHREITYGGRSLEQGISTWFDTHSFSAQNPDTGKVIKWSGEKNVRPIMLDFVNGDPYLVVWSAKVFSNVKLYGCPEIPYAFLKYDEKISQWIPVPRNLAPRVLHRANLSADYDGTYMMDGKRQTKGFIADRYETAKGSSNGSITAEIPENYDTWDYYFKREYNLKRYENDCRPPLPVEAATELPPPREVAMEILKTRDYDPDRIIDRDEWSHLTYDKNREEYSSYCKSLFKQADPEKPWLGMRFAQDKTGQKKVPYNKDNLRTGVHRMCNKNYILYYAHLEIPDKMVVTKYTLDGNLLYRISFKKPEELKGFTGYINTPSLESKNGYLNFEWWHFTDKMDHKKHETVWNVKRIIKARIREPKINR
jgi:hypothetical protein